MKLFEVTNTTWENLQIPKHKSVQCAEWITLICALRLQIFSGCAYHLEELHAQSPFLFPIVFSINIIVVRKRSVGNVRKNMHRKYSGFTAPLQYLDLFAFCLSFPFPILTSPTRALVAVEPHRPPMTNVSTETAFRHDHCKHFEKSKHLFGSEVSWCDHRLAQTPKEAYSEVRVHTGTAQVNFEVDRPPPAVLHQEIFWSPW